MDKSLVTQVEAWWSTIQELERTYCRLMERSSLLHRSLSDHDQSEAHEYCLQLKGFALQLDQAREYLPLDIIEIYWGSLPSLSEPDHKISRPEEVTFLANKLPYGATKSARLVLWKRIINRIKVIAEPPKHIVKIRCTTGERDIQ